MLPQSLEAEITMGCDFMVFRFRQQHLLLGILRREGDSHKRLFLMLFIVFPNLRNLFSSTKPPVNLKDLWIRVFTASQFK